MRRKKDPFFVRLSRSLNGFVPLFIFLALVANLIIVYRFETTRKPQVVYSVERVFAPTNTSSSSLQSLDSVRPSSIPPADSVRPSDDPSFEDPFFVNSTNVLNRTICSVEYSYFIINGRRGVRMWNSYYWEGSPTSFGRICRIFPDRILLNDGFYISNLNWNGGGFFAAPERSRRDLP